MINSRKLWLVRHNSYSFRFWRFFDYGIFRRISYTARGGKGKGDRFNDVIIMLDTETSKERAGEICSNYIVAWTMSVRAYGMNIVTLYGTRPSECVSAINSMMMNMPGDKN